MTCYNLNEAVYNKIENALDNPKKETTPTVESFFKSIYGPATLMNDWYEKRYTEVTETVTEPWLSENMDEFRAPCRTLVPDRHAYFNKIFDAYGLGQELLTDHQGYTYYENYTTTNDLMYNHLTKGICGPMPRHYVRGVYKPETDLMKVFGNLTQWGLKEEVYSNSCEQNDEIEENKSETMAEFVYHDPQTVRKLNDFKTFKKVKYEY